ncbi:uncharacterized protein LOC129598814 [Paramacrobiotus metropolitanus]|uniref:uncharacterized protein LOC129598814 n=1 Tax=Paramacrobiotus metropolitanus TaxID=2943436 RepID=UPI0024459F01|nr:uncharacterized protein LOC129598814 [Paramacrobiotus metropolitanus]XP_055352851.1 uncharacterized protein LOC129598814 [Paramacrobiotus metropolitanus]XP_055352852.1 uncharacterized protein LOC129598814 [Paramacrobiotus metropolitanus]XP_055352853.1 uncharacterized protein LOC129598814 [Paramacrobiotus metropolitanus]
MSYSVPSTPAPNSSSATRIPVPFERAQPGDAARSPRSPNGPLGHDPPDPNAPFPEHASVLQLLVLALKTPDYGVVNFRSLYCLLEYLINRLDIGQDRVDLTERPSRELIREAVRWMPEFPGSERTGKDVVDFRSDQRIATLEHRVSTLRLQMEAFHELPTTDRLSERMAEKTGEAGRTSSPLIEAWQVAQLSKRMDAAEQSLEKAFSVMDELLDGVNKVKKLKHSLMRYIQRWMFNPDAAFQQALNGEAFGDDDEEEDLAVPNKFPFVTWPALREVLINRQAENDAEASPLSAVLEAFAPLVTIPENGDEPRTADAERRSTSSGRASSVPARERSRSVSFPKDARDLATTAETETEKRRSTKALDAARDTTRESVSPLHSPDHSSPGSSPRSTSRALSLRESLDVPSFIAPPDGEVLHSLTKIGNLLKWSKRVEARLNRLEAYLGNVANKDEFRRIADDLDEVRKSIAPLSEWVSEWGPSHIGAELIPAQIANTGLQTTAGSALPDQTVKVTEGGGSRPVSPLFDTDDQRPSAETQALHAQMRELNAANEAQKRLLAELQSRASIMAAELAAVSKAVKEQAAKLPAAPSRIAIQPKLSLPKTEKSPCTQGPSQSQFDIFCRACAENFQMVELRLAELENTVDHHADRLQNLNELISRLDRIKADIDQVAGMISPKADAAEVRNKVDRHQFMEVANILQQKLLDMKDDLKLQAEAMDSSLGQLDYRINNEMNNESHEQLLEQTNRNIQLVHNRVIQLEGLLHVDSAAGAKRPFGAYKCVSCDKPVDPHPSSRTSGWPHAYITDSIRPHLEMMKYRAIQSGDASDAQKLREAKFRNLAVAKQLQRHMREQECLEFKQAANHYGDTKFPHCDHQVARPVGGRVIGQLRSKSDQISDRNPRKYIEDRLDSFIKKNNLAIQYPKSARFRRSYPATDIPGYPDMNIRSVAQTNQPALPPVNNEPVTLQPGMLPPKSSIPSAPEKNQLFNEIKEAVRVSPIPEDARIPEVTNAAAMRKTLTAEQNLQAVDVEMVRIKIEPQSVATAVVHPAETENSVVVTPVQNQDVANAAGTVEPEVMLNPENS